MRRKSWAIGTSLAEVSAAGKGLRSLDSMSNDLRWVTVARLSLERGDVVMGVGCGKPGSIFPSSSTPSAVRYASLAWSSAQTCRRRQYEDPDTWVGRGQPDRVFRRGCGHPCYSGRRPVLPNARHIAIRRRRGERDVPREDGGDVSKLGPRWAPWWAAPVNFGAWLITRRYAQGAFSAVGPSRDIRTGSPS
jgi:hypothetical protein